MKLKAKQVEFVGMILVLLSAFWQVFIERKMAEAELKASKSAAWTARPNSGISN